MKQHFILFNKAYPFIFVVPPRTLNIQTGQKTVSVDLIDFGEKVNIGERQCDKISFETFLPNTKSHFYSVINPLPPTAGIIMLKKWQTDQAKLTFLVPELLLNFTCNLTNLNYSIEDRTGDIYVNVTLVEKRIQNKVTDNITGLFPRL